MLGPLARVDEPLGREQLREHRAVVVADSSCTIAGLAYSVLGGQALRPCKRRYSRSVMARASAGCRVSAWHRRRKMASWWRSRRRSGRADRVECRVAGWSRGARVATVAGAVTAAAPGQAVSTCGEYGGWGVTHECACVCVGGAAYGRALRVAPGGWVPCTTWHHRENDDD